MDARTIDTYNKLAKEYDEETAEFWDNFPRTFINNFAELAKGRVLDIGSGPGREALIFKEKGLDVTCLDASEAMVKISTEKGLRSILGNFFAMPFQDGEFDGAWAYTSLLHARKADAVKAMGEARRVLKDGGILALGLIEGNTEGYRESSGINMPRWFSYYTQSKAEKLLADCGFEIVYFEKFKPKTKEYLNFIARKK